MDVRKKDKLTGETYRVRNSLLDIGYRDHDMLRSIRGGDYHLTAVGDTISIPLDTPLGSEFKIGDLAFWVKGETGAVLIKGLHLNIVAKTENYTATAIDDTIICDATGGAFTITLPAASTVSGKIYNIKKIDVSANAVTIDGDDSETIDDAATKALSSQYDSLTIQSSGAEWWII